MQYSRLFYFTAPQAIAEKPVYVFKTEQEIRTRLGAAQTEIKTLQEILPICSFCKKIRYDRGYWNLIEEYLKKHTTTRLSHSRCPECLEKKSQSICTDTKRLTEDYTEIIFRENPKYRSFP